MSLCPCSHYRHNVSVMRLFHYDNMSLCRKREQNLNTLICRHTFKMEFQCSSQLLNLFKKENNNSQLQIITWRKYKDEWFPIVGLLKNLLQIKSNTRDEFRAHSFDNKQPDGLYQTLGPQNFDNDKALETGEGRGVPAKLRGITVFTCKTVKVTRLNFIQWKPVCVGLSSRAVFLACLGFQTQLRFRCSFYIFFSTFSDWP